MESAAPVLLCKVDADSDAPPSVGSVGHPHSCALPCKFASKVQGCSFGASCVRCHVCKWQGWGFKQSSPAAPPRVKPQKITQREARAKLLGESLEDALFCDSAQGADVSKSREAMVKLHEHLESQRSLRTRCATAATLKVGDSACTALISGGELCSIGIASPGNGFRQTFVEVLATVVPPTADALLAELPTGFDARSRPQTLSELRVQLLQAGFTVAPWSGELVDIVKGMQGQDLETLRRSFMPQDMPLSPIAKACVSQLRHVLQSGAAVLGPYKMRLRLDMRDHAKSIHKDDVRLTEDDVRLALFPSQWEAAVPTADVFDRYTSFCEDVARHYPSLALPCSPDVLEQFALNRDIHSLTQMVLDAIQNFNNSLTRQEDELIFDNVNVWIPRNSKQLVFLPLADSERIEYPLGPASVEQVIANFTGHFQAFRRGTALFFFGQSILHQALVGPGFDCSGGSLEGRYLVLIQRKHAHSGSLRIRMDGFAELASVEEHSE